MAHSGDDDSEGDWDTDSGDEIEEEQATKCLFSDDVLPSVTAALEHDATYFGFDLCKYVKQACDCTNFFFYSVYPALRHVCAPSKVAMYYCTVLL